MLRFSGTGVSEVGKVRDHNEDAAFVGPYVALVADGVGGAAAGEVASATVAYVVSATALARFGAPLESVLHEAATAARRQLRAGVRQDAARAGMATTLSVLVCDGRRVLLGHLGDSRAYLFREGELRMVSHDHTYVQDLVDSGQLRSEDAKRHPWRNVVLRSFHTDPGELTDPDGDDAHPDDADLDLIELDARPGDRFLLCSDGLTDLVVEEDIAEALGIADAHSAAAVLTHAALEAGGTDNVTCVVVDVVDGPLVVGDGRPLGAMFDFSNIVDPAGVRRG